MCVVVGVQRALKTPIQSLYSFFYSCTDYLIELVLNNVLYATFLYIFALLSMVKLWADTFVQGSGRPIRNYERNEAKALVLARFRFSPHNYNQLHGLIVFYQQQFYIALSVTSRSIPSS